MKWSQRFADLGVRGLTICDTTGMANVLASVQTGIHRFDGSLGGLGECPYAPGARGNICSEDAVHMLDVVGHTVPGQVA